MSQKDNSLLDHIARHFGLFLLVIILLTTAAFAASTWPSGEAPRAAPGNGNVQLGSVWSQSGTTVYYNGGRVGIGTATPGVELEVVGDIKSTRFFYNSSDERLKKDIAIIPNALAKINQLSGVSFKWKNADSGDGNNLGVIAQDVEKVFPELIATDEISGMKSVQYSNLVAPLIEAVKELTAKVEDLEKRIDELK
jgi:hypothetical protein